MAEKLRNEKKTHLWIWLGAGVLALFGLDYFIDDKH